MQNAAKRIVGSVAMLLCLAGTWNAYSQYASHGVAYQNPVPQASTYSALEANRLDELSAEIAALRSQLAQKADKPSAGKGWSSPKFGDRFFMDYVTAMDQDWDGLDAAMGRNVNTQNGLGFREARITMTGTGYGFLDYKFELGFEKSSQYNPSYKDIFVGIQNVPFLEYVRVGHQYVEDAGSEICNGTTNYTFMEAPAPAGQHFTARRLGVSSRHLFADDRARLFMGIYDATNIGDIHYMKDDNQGVMLNTRFTFAPAYCQEGRQLFLYGAYYNYVNSDGPRALALNRPGGWDVYDPSSFGSFYSDQYQKAGFEVVYQSGRFSVQTDLFLQHYADVNNGTGVSIGNQTNYGGFVMARLFLTRDDYRKYNLKSACWDGVDVSCPFHLVKRGDVNCPSGYGAWEMAAMYGFYDMFLFSTAIPAAADAQSTNHQVGVALNWYWNQHVKWAVNYFHDMSDTRYAGNGYDPNGDYFGMTCRVAF